MTVAEKRAARSARNDRIAGAPPLAIGGDPVSLHRWLNIMAVRGSARAETLRGELAARMSKADLARAMRAARDDLAAAA